MRSTNRANSYDNFLTSITTLSEYFISPLENKNNSIETVWVLYVVLFFMGGSIAQQKLANISGVLVIFMIQGHQVISVKALIFAILTSWNLNPGYNVRRETDVYLHSGDYFIVTFSSNVVCFYEFFPQSFLFTILYVLFD